VRLDKGRLERSDSSTSSTAITKQPSTHRFAPRRVRDAPVTAVFLSDLEPSKRIDKIMSIEKSYRAPEYNAMMPLAAGYFTGEGPWLGNAIKNVAAAAMSPVKPMPTISKVEVWR